MEITDKEYEKILKEYFLILEKYTNLDYKCTNLQNENNELKDEIRNVLVLALFDFYGLDFSAEDLGEEESVRLKV